MHDQGTKKWSGKLRGIKELVFRLRWVDALASVELCLDCVRCAGRCFHLLVLGVVLGACRKFGSARNGETIEMLDDVSKVVS